MELAKSARLDENSMTTSAVKQSFNLLETTNLKGRPRLCQNSAKFVANGTALHIGCKVVSD